MARPGVTYSDVARAATALLAQQSNPTVDTVRGFLGTGSKATIAPLLKRWKAEQDNYDGDPARAGVPQEIVAAIQGVWQSLQHQRDTAIAATQAEATARIEEMETRWRDSQREVQSLQETVKERDTTLAGALRRIEQYREEIQTQHTALQVQAERLESLAALLRDKEHAMDDLQVKYTQVQTNLDHYRQQVAAQRKEEKADYEQQRQRLESDNRDLRRELKESQQSRTQLQSALDALGEQQRITEKDHQAVKRQLEATLKEKDRTVVEVTRVQASYTTLQENHSKLLNDDKSRQQELNSLSKAQAVLEEQVRNLSRINEKLQDQNNSLQDEKLFLSQEKARLEGTLQQWQQNHHK